MSRCVDLTLPLTPGDRGVTMEPRFTVEHDGWNASTWHLYSHAGTHMDAPVHFAAGPGTIDRQPLERCMGPARVVRLRPCPPRAWLTVDHLGVVAATFQPGESLLLHTGWSEHAGDPAMYRDQLPRVSDELAQWCVDQRVNVLGVEAPSVADVNHLPEVTRIHQILLGGGVTIVEGLAHLDRLRHERVWFAALPLKLAGADGCPVRAFAFDGAESPPSMPDTPPDGSAASR